GACRSACTGVLTVRTDPCRAVARDARCRCRGSRRPSPGRCWGCRTAFVLRRHVSPWPCWFSLQRGLRADDDRADQALPQACALTTTPMKKAGAFPEGSASGRLSAERRAAPPPRACVDQAAASLSFFSGRTLTLTEAGL